MILNITGDGMTERPRSPYLHTVDVVVLRYISGRDESGKTQHLEVLLNKREREPFAGSWALPGLVVNGDQEDISITDAARRLMRSDKVGLEPLYLEQIGTEGNAVRDPRCWSSTTFYLAFVSADQQINAHQQFVKVNDVITGAFKLPFDHTFIVTQVMERLVSKTLYSSLPLLMLGSRLTLTEAVEVTSCVLGRDQQKSSMRVRLEAMVKAGFLQETGEKKQMGMGRPQVIIKNIKPTEIFYFDRCLEG